MTTTTLGRAKRGDQDAFRELVDPYRRQLHVHCYRILGSFQDAEDVLQEVLLSAWRALDDFDGRSLRAWLYRIATNRCLNYLRDGSRRPRADNFPEQGAVRSDEPWWLEPYPDVLLDDVALGPEARYEVPRIDRTIFCRRAPAVAPPTTGCTRAPRRTRVFRL